MNCKDVGTLRAFLDGELSDEDSSEMLQHLERCSRCDERLQQLKSTETTVKQAFFLLKDLTPIEQVSETRALARVNAKLESSDAKRSGRATIIRRFNVFTNILSFRYRLAVAGVAALVVLALIGMTPQGQVAAANFLAQFRAQKLQVVSVDPREMGKVIEDLSNFGSVDTSHLERQSLSPAATVAEATQKVGFQVKQPKTLPAGVSSDPTIAVKPATTLSFTFNVAKAQQYLASVGQSNFKVPSKFDGAKLNLHLPSAVMLVYGQNSSKPIMVGESGAPTGDITGNVTPLEMRDFLLSLPGLSKETVAQLRVMDDWMNTLPIPVPKDQANWHEVDLGGVKAIVVGDNTGLGSIVLWQQDGMIYGVAGQYKEQELLTVARSLR